MKKSLSDFVKNYINLDDEEFNHVTSRFSQKFLKKNEHLLHEGDVCNEFIIIIKGYTRVYLIDESGREITVWFGLPDNIGSDVQSFISAQPSQFSIQAIDEVEYLTLPKKDFYSLSETIPKWQKFQATLWGSCVVDLINRTLSFQYKSAQERYEILQQDVKITQLVPQKYLASFLGITPTSLSHLRKKIYAKRL